MLGRRLASALCCSWNEMEDNQHLLPEDADHELEAQISRYVRKVIPVLVATKNTARVLRRLTSVGAQTVEAALEAGTSWFQLKKARNEHSIAQLADLSGGQSAMGVKVAQRLIENSAVWTNWFLRP